MIKTPKFWRSINLTAILLYPLCLVYLLISTIIFYIQKPKKFNTKIICIGNVTAGGSGKTPVAIMLGKLLKKNDYKIAYVCKNYLATIKTPTKISKSHKSPDVVEESLLLSKVADTFVAENIIDALSAADQQSYDYIITDDGLQNNKFYKDISILTINGQIGLGNNMLLPSGPLRESLKSAIHRSDIIFMIGEDKKEILKKIPNHNYIKLIQKFNLKYYNATQRYIAFSGIGYPEKFFKSLEDQKIHVIETIEYPDHYIYSVEDIESLIKKANNAGVALITTEKDMIKIPDKYKNKISCLFIELFAEKEEKLLQNIESL